jgi:hypothetical protein
MADTFTDASFDAVPTNQDFSSGSSGSGVLDTLFGGGGTSNSPIGSAAGGIGSLIGGISGAQASAATASGYQQEASLYKQAAGLAAQDEGIVWQEGNLQEASTELTTSEKITQAQAAEAAAGVEGGSAGDILRMSQEQQSLQLGGLRTSTALTANEFTQMETAYNAQAAAATSAASAAQSSGASGILGGILGAVGKIAPVIAGL